MQSFSEMDFRIPSRRKLEKGQLIEGQIVSIGAQHIFLDIGTKSEASLDINEVKDNEGKLSLKLGDKITAYIVTTDPEIVLSYALARPFLNKEALADAHDLGIPVDGKIVEVNKGGFSIDLNGIRAFCPISQIDTTYCTNPDQYLGQELQFRVMEYAEDGRNIVVSRRALLEEEQEEAMAETRAQLFEGAIFSGKVMSVQPYGAFIDIGGIQGMVHISEICHHRIAHAEEALHVGESVKVKVLSIEADPKHPDRERIALSIKGLLPNPAQDAALDLKEGASVSGKIVRLQPYGAFIEIAPGVDGLAHISELSDKRINHPSEILEVGQQVNATVLKVDTATKKISLSLRSATTVADDALTVGAVVDVEVDRIKPFGLLVRIKGAGREARGLIPTEETGAGRNTNLRKSYTEGAEHKAMIVSIEPETGRLRLSFKAYTEYLEQQDMKTSPNWVGSAASTETATSLGTFGDLLKKSIKKQA